MRVDDFDYYLPPHLIAQQPAAERDLSRLMVLHREPFALEHRLFKDLPEYLSAGDCLVLNQSKVIPARLWAVKEPGGGRVEVLLLHQVENNVWEALVRPGRKVPSGTVLVFGSGEQRIRGQVREKTASGGRVILFDCHRPLLEVLGELGSLPLPPYIKEEPVDPNRYQTVYAKTPGSVAAPTAGLHFTPRLLEQLQDKGVHIVRLILHVGLGTFRPVQVAEVEKHTMHAEYYELEAEAAQVINEVKSSGRGRVIAVGTTSTRCLESVAAPDGTVCPGKGFTDIFIYPGYRFKVIDGLITNFHLPRSTLLMLVSALAGREKILAAYQEAVRLSYRFFSFGDAMLII
ncbi:MAG: tRNA preQ1(34) S-adenosylmethionine ribosyltransferase-isomerase QueA [Bacillota bacterium]|uniref:tRNA preQ1(34) S-adenosylmethionine ribosyltransferase-isomerase QueA n=1 Tax=Desulfurispora thermophila TaxID=265470 RepID=UPI000368562E|nr:tRNA preQ1(34) S-adenosylmethionine ribosyltransferase-isomerase QueA [Desulfurispora thermophila]